MDNSFSITAICDQVMPSIDDEINAGYGHFPIIANLPEIKQIDFIKAVAAILGVLLFLVRMIQIPLSLFL